MLHILGFNNRKRLTRLRTKQHVIRFADLAPFGLGTLNDDLARSDDKLHTKLLFTPTSHLCDRRCNEPEFDVLFSEL